MARATDCRHRWFRDLVDAYESKPGPTARRAGAFLAIVVSQIDTITISKTIL